MAQNTSIPQCNPKANYLKYKAEIDSAVSRVLDNGYYILGPEVEAFEDEFAAYTGAKYAVGVANGTDAIELALLAAGVGPSDYVATVSHTAVATLSAIRRMGANPIFVDIDPNFFTMSVESLEEVISLKKIKAIVVVHIYGQMAEIHKILSLAKKHNIIVIEDCAQAHGAVNGNQMAGSIGDIGCFSFYPTKNLGALGDGGAVITSNESFAKKIKSLRQYGWEERYISSSQGINSRLDELQAAILRVKLPFLAQDNNNRKDIAKVYSENLENHHLIQVPLIRAESTHVFHQYVVLSSKRDFIKEQMIKENIIFGLHYPKPVHHQSAYALEEYKIVSLEVTDKLASEILSFPMFPELSLDDAYHITKKVNALQL